MERVYGFDGGNIVSQMFDPYFYFDTQDPYSDWGDYREKVFVWLKENNVKTIVTYQNFERYAKLAEYEPDYVKVDGTISNSNLIVYQVDAEKIAQDF